MTLRWSNDLGSQLIQSVSMEIGGARASKDSPKYRCSECRCIYNMHPPICVRTIIDRSPKYNEMQQLLQRFGCTLDHAQIEKWLAEEIEFEDDTNIIEYMCMSPEETWWNLSERKCGCKKFNKITNDLPGTIVDEYDKEWLDFWRSLDRRSD